MLVVRNAPTTAISEVMSSSRISVSFMCRLRNTADTSFSYESGGAGHFTEK